MARTNEPTVYILGVAPLAEDDVEEESGAEDGYSTSIRRRLNSSRTTLSVRASARR